MGDKLEELLAQRNAIDRELKKQFEREVAVLFTDVVGSTAYFERQGDIAGVALLVRHNDLLFPLVGEHRGRIIKTIGDAIMAVFDQPADAVRCAAEMQTVLAKDRSRTVGEAIHIRVGLHAGPAIHMDEDVFGDAVNTAARVASKASADEILLSVSLWQRVAPLQGLFAQPRQPMALKGKAEPLAVAALHWGEGAPSSPPPPPSEPSAELVVLELSRGKNGVKVSVLDGARDKGTVKSYEEVSLTRSLDDLAQRLETFLQGGAETYRERIGELGRELFTTALPPRVQQTLRQTRHRFLRLQVDDELAHVPWELAHDGEEFLAVRLATGRLVAARGEPPPPPGTTTKAGHALVAADLTGGLAHAAAEGRAVAGLLEENYGGGVRLLTGPASRAELLDAISAAALVHIAGHAQPGGSGTPAGFRVADGVVTGAEIAEVLRVRPPLLVFANGCFASIGRAWTRGARSANDLATPLLWSGVRHFLGPIGDIPDSDALTFAVRFYEAVLTGVPVGEAVRRGRLALLGQASESPSFAAYLLYGDPRLQLPEALARRQRGAVRAGDVMAPATGATLPARSRARAGRPLRALGLLLTAGGLIAAGLWWAGRAPSKLGPAPTPAVTAPAKSLAADSPTPSAVPASERTGLIRLSVLPFRNLGGAADLDYLAGGLAEISTTELSGAPAFELVERHLLTDERQNRDQVLVKDVLGEIQFEQTGFVDPTTRAAMGKLRGVEVLVVGGFQRAGNTLRITTRFVDTPTGRVLLTLSVDGAAGAPFALQDALAARLRRALPQIRAALRPSGVDP